jgi:hypothetical protein
MVADQHDGRLVEVVSTICEWSMDSTACGEEVGKLETNA